VIQFLLLAGTLLLGIVLFRGKPSAGHLAFRRLLALFVVVIGATSILFPGLVTSLANLIGVGRGTDLVLYVSVLAFLFVTVGMYQRMSSLEERCVALARKLAIIEAQRDHSKATRERIV